MNARFSWQQRVGLVVGEVAVRLPVESVTRSSPAARAAGRPSAPAMPLPPSTTTRRGVTVARVDEPQRRRPELLADVDVLAPSRRPAGLARPASIGAGCPGGPGRRTARSRRAPPAWPRCTPWGCGRRCTSARRRGRGSRRGSRASRWRSSRRRARGPLGHHPVAVAGGQLGGRRAHVVAQADAQFGRRLVREAGEHADEGPADRPRRRRRRAPRRRGRGCRRP